MIAVLRLAILISAAFAVAAATVLYEPLLKVLIRRWADRFAVPNAGPWKTLRDPRLHRVWYIVSAVVLILVWLWLGTPQGSSSVYQLFHLPAFDM